MSRAHRGKAAAQLARALGDPLRLAILHRLLEGPAAVADLVATTGEGQPKVSNHLAVLRERNLIVAKRTGRQVVYELRDPAVAQLVEVLLQISGPPTEATQPPAPISVARTCYDHLAGKLGVSIFDALVAKGTLAPTGGVQGEVIIQPQGAEVFRRLGVNTRIPPRSRRRFAYACLDWTERRPHLGGWLGASLCDRAFEAGWLIREQGSRAAFVTPSGKKAFKRLFGLDT